MPGKVDLRTRNISKDKKGYFMKIKVSINQEDITILNIYAPNNKVSKYVKQIWIELQRDIGKFTITVRNFITLSIINRSRQKIPSFLNSDPRR